MMIFLRGMGRLKREGYVHKGKNETSRLTVSVGWSSLYAGRVWKILELEDVTGNYKLLIKRNLKL